MADAFDLDMRAISAVLDDDDYVLHSLMCDVEGGDNRKRRRNGWQRLQPHLGDPGAGKYLSRFRGPYWLSVIWKDIINDDTYVLGSYAAKEWEKDYMLPRKWFDKPPTRCLVTARSR